VCEREALGVGSDVAPDVIRLCVVRGLSCVDGDVRTTVSKETHYSVKRDLLQRERASERQSAERLRLLVGVALRRCIVGVGRRQGQVGT
jgi:hypothetical protein